ncbi:MAG: hypothetical protein LBG80_19830 [Bacteroidales bacterium]|jgi:hypothetical protein|nr:hypothetical protein [Bacteroidales bacterium]
MEIVKKIVNSYQYQNLIKDIQKRTKLKILDEYRDAAANRDEQKIEIAHLSEKDIFEILDNQINDFKKFVLLKMQKFENVKVDEEYPEGEEIDDDDVNETVLGYSQGFLLMYLIEYCLLKDNLSNMLTYLKAIRIPHASKYEKELKEIYNKL